MSSIKKTILVYSNLPSGGAKYTHESTSKFLEKFYSVKQITEPNYDIKNIFHYLYVALVISPKIQKKLLTENGHFDFLLVYQSWLVKSPSILTYTNKPIIYICHDVLREYYDNKHIELQTTKEKIINLLRLPVKILDLHNIKSSNAAIISNSIFSQKLIYDAYGLQSKVIYPGIKHEKYIPANKLAKSNQIVSIGAINKFKMQSFFIDVIGLIPLEIRPKLVLICNGIDKKYLSELLKKSNTSHVKVVILRNISEKQKVLELQKSKAFIYAGVNEPFGIAVEEGIASGLPLIIYGKGGGYTEIINRRMGIIIDNLDQKKWADELLFMLTNDQIQRKFSRYNIKYASKHLNSDIMNKKILKLIKNSL